MAGISAEMCFKKIINYGGIVEDDWTDNVMDIPTLLILSLEISGLPDQFTPLSNLLPDFFRKGTRVWQQLK